MLPLVAFAFAALVGSIWLNGVLKDALARARWPVLAFMSASTLLLGLSRLDMGVHHPSDVLAGWAAGALWAVACFFALLGRHRHPWNDDAARLDSTVKSPSRRAVRPLPANSLA